MKKDPKAFDMANRQNGKQTVKSEPIGNEANSRVENPVKTQYAVEKKTSKESHRFIKRKLRRCRYL